MKTQIQCNQCDVILQTIEKDAFHQSDIDNYNQQYLSNPIAEGDDIPENYIPEYKPCICCNEHPDGGIRIGGVEISQAVPKFGSIVFTE